MKKSRSQQENEAMAENEVFFREQNQAVHQENPSFWTVKKIIPTPTSSDGLNETALTNA